jgi:inhibitor of cysteine peptidase
MFPQTNYLVLGVLCLALAACAASGPQTVSLNEADAGREISLQKGDTLEISLEGNPGTGYSWELAGGELACLEPLGEAEFVQEKNLLGSPGRMILRYSAVAAGEETLQLVYHRSWETDVPPEASFAVAIVVK